MKDDVSLNVANAFLQILFNKENIKVQKELLASSDERQLSRAQELVNADRFPEAICSTVRPPWPPTNKK
jgi:outer membrane protein